MLHKDTGKIALKELSLIDKTVIDIKGYSLYYGLKCLLGILRDTTLVSLVNMFNPKQPSR